jgi:hypothetical protein
MADQGFDTKGTREGRSSLVVQIKKYLLYTWEGVKFLLGALIAFMLSPLGLSFAFGYFMFFAGMLAYRELGGDANWFAFYAILALINAVAVVIELRNLYRRWSR